MDLNVLETKQTKKREVMGSLKKEKRKEDRRNKRQLAIVFFGGRGEVIAIHNK